MTQALALQLNFKTTQQANEKALGDLFKPKSISPGLRQTLQARAAIYGDLLDPSWFVRNSDLSSKLKSLKDRRLARSMLMGAVLMITQVGAHNIRTLLMSGESDALKNVPPDTKGTIADFQEVLSKSSPMSILLATK